MSRSLRHAFPAGRLLRVVALDALAVVIAYHALRDLGGVGSLAMVTGMAVALGMAGSLACIALATVDPRVVMGGAYLAAALLLLGHGALLCAGVASVGVTMAAYALVMGATTLAVPLDGPLLARWSETGERGAPDLAWAVSLAGGGLFAGPVVGGVLSDLLGSGPAFVALGLLLATGTLVALAGLRGVSPARPDGPAGASRVGTAVGQAREGFSLVRRDRALTGRIVAYAVFGPFAWTWEVLVPAIALSLGIGASAYGAIVSLSAASEVVVPVLLRTRLDRLSRYTATTIIGVPALRVAALVPVALAPSAPLLVVALCVSRASQVVEQLAWTAAFRGIAPAHRAVVSSVGWLTGDVGQLPVRLVLPAVVAAVGASAALGLHVLVALAGFGACFAWARRAPAAGARDRSSSPAGHPAGDTP